MLEVLNSVVGFLDGLLGSSGTISLVLTVVLDTVQRLFKTEKPKSVLWMLRDGADGLSKALGKAAQLLDKVLGNRVVK